MKLFYRTGVLIAACFVATPFLTQCKPNASVKSKLRELDSATSLKIFARMFTTATSESRFVVNGSRNSANIVDNFALDLSFKGGAVDIANTSSDNELKLGGITADGKIEIGPDSLGRDESSKSLAKETCSLSAASIFVSFDEETGSMKSGSPAVVDCSANGSTGNDSKQGGTPAEICAKFGGTVLGEGCSCTGKPEAPNPDVFVMFPKSATDANEMASYENELKNCVVKPSGSDPLPAPVEFKKL